MRLVDILSLIEIIHCTELVVSCSEVRYQENKSFIKGNLQKTAVDLQDLLSAVGHTAGEISI